MNPIRNILAIVDPTATEHAAVSAVLRMANDR
jgi:hypothetical protein